MFSFCVSLFFFFFLRLVSHGFFFAWCMSAPAWMRRRQHSASPERHAPMSGVYLGGRGHIIRGTGCPVSCVTFTVLDGGKK